MSFHEKYSTGMHCLVLLTIVFSMSNCESDNLDNNLLERIGTKQLTENLCADGYYTHNSFEEQL